MCGRLGELTINSVKLEMACLEELVWPFQLVRRSLALFIHSVIAVDSWWYLWSKKRVVHASAPSSNLKTRKHLSHLSIFTSSRVLKGGVQSRGHFLFSFANRPNAVLASESPRPLCTQGHPTSARTRPLSSLCWPDLKPDRSVHHLLLESPATSDREENGTIFIHHIQVVF